MMDDGVEWCMMMYDDEDYVDDDYDDCADAG